MRAATYAVGGIPHGRAMPHSVPMCLHFSISTVCIYKAIHMYVVSVLYEKHLHFEFGIKLLSRVLL